MHMHSRCGTVFSLKTHFAENRAVSLRTCTAAVTKATVAFLKGSALLQLLHSFFSLIVVFLVSVQVCSGRLLAPHYHNINNPVLLFRRKHDDMEMI
jgi:hypothetical protein